MVEIGVPCPAEIRVSERLHQKRRLLSRRIWSASHRLWSHPEIARMYPSFLFRSHCNARSTVPLFEAAVARLESLPADPLTAGLTAFLTRFIPEEIGHDEWVLEDLEALGVSRQEVLARVPPPSLAALVGAQYYWIAHHHPVTLLGYCFITETSSASIREVEDLIRRSGLPRCAFRTLLRHAVIDLEHGSVVERALDTLPLTSDHLSIIGVSMAHTLSCIALSTEEICHLYEIRRQEDDGEEHGIRLF